MSEMISMFSSPHLTATTAFLFSSFFMLALFYDFRKLRSSFKELFSFLLIVFFSFFVCSGILGLFFILLTRWIPNPISHMVASTFALAVYAFFCGLFFSSESTRNQICMGTVFVCISQPSYFALNGILSRLIFPYDVYSYEFNDALTLCIYPVFLFFVVLFLRYFSVKDSRKMPRSSWLSIILISMTGFIMTVPFYNKVVFRDDLYSLIAAIIFISVLCDFSAYYFSYSLCKEYIRNLDLTKLELRAEDDFKIMERTNLLYDKIRSMRHELKNHLSLMRIMTQQKNYEELEHYLDEMCEKSYPILNTSDCKNPTVRMLINNAISMMAIENIQLNTYVSVPDVLPLSDTDLCSLLSNLTINAYEAAILSPNPRITISVKVENDFLFISVKNSVRESVLANNPQLMTSKHFPENHGLGIKTIKNIAAKYNGNVVFSEQDQMFIVNVMLVLPKTVS